MGKFDVLIAGGGPAGSYLALLLAERGFDVALFEERAIPNKGLRCTGIVSTVCFEKFSLPKEAVLGAKRKASFISPSGIKIELEREKPEALILRREILDKALFERAGEGGTSLFPGTKVIEVRDGDEVEFRTTHGIFKGKVGVIASGFLSSLTKLSGGFGDFVMGGQVEAETGEDGVEVYFGRKIFYGFFGWLVPIGEGRGLVGLFTRGSPPRELRRFIERLRMEGKIGLSGDPHFWGVPLLPPRRITLGNLLLVGDSAGQVKPTTGGGIYWGLTGAEIASRAIEGKIKWGKSLSLYQLEWESLMGRERELCYFIRRFWEGLDDGAMDFAFRMGREALSEAVASPSFSFDFHGRILLETAKRLVLSFRRLPSILTRGNSG